MIARNSRAATRAAFTLMEVLVVVAIILILAGAGGYIYMNHLENAKKDLCKANVMALDQEIGAWRTRHGDYPTQLAELAALGPNGEAATIENKMLLDPWNQPYFYEPQNLHPLTKKPHIYSNGATPGNPAGRISNWEGNQ